MKKIYIIDSMFYIFRSFYAIRPEIMVNGQGIHTNALYGYITSIEKILDNFSPQYIVAAFDSSSETFRKKIWSGYKSNRKECPKELVPQFPLVKEYLKLRGIKIVNKEGFEADDIIGTIAKSYSEKGFQVIICSHDKDMFQLLSSTVFVCHTYKNNRIIGKKELKEDLGIESTQVIDYLSITGDSSDNIPGLPGIGDKGAVQLLQKYGSLEAIREHKNELKGKRFIDAVNFHWEKAEMSKKLVTIDRFVPLKDQSYEFQPIDNQEIVSFFQKHSLNRFIQTFQSKQMQIQGGKSFASLLKKSKKIMFSVTSYSQIPFKVEFSSLKISFDDHSQEFYFYEWMEIKSLASIAKGKEFIYDAKEYFFTHNDVENEKFLSWHLLLALYLYDEYLLYKILCQRWGNLEIIITSSIEELKFNEILKECVSTIKTKKLAASYQLIEEEQDLEDLLVELAKASEIALDLETDNLLVVNASIVGIGFCFSVDKAYYIPFNGKIEPKKICRLLKPILESPDKKYFGHNIKYDYQVLLNYNIDLKQISFDTILSAYVCNPSQNSYSLENLTLMYFNYKMMKFSDLISVNSPRDLFNVELEIIKDYCCEDVHFTFLLKSLFENALKRRESENIFYNLELPLLKVLAQMEYKGISLDQNYLRELHQNFQMRIYELREEVFEIVGEEFNLDSPKQMAVMLFEKLKLPPKKKTQLGYSTDAEVLEELAVDYAIAKKIIDYRQLAKLDSTYTLALIKTVSLKTQRVHTSFLQTGTVTGRLSSSNPNLQNIPTKTELGKKIRRAFIAPIGKEFFVCDYSQIELRILAHFSKDESLLDAFNKELDIHAYIASIINKIPIEKVSNFQRSLAKAVNFGIIYGQGSRKLAKSLKISVEEANEFIKKYFSRYEKVKSFMQNLIADARDKGYSETLFKRKRYIPEFQSKNKRLVSFAERIAINSPIQGTASDIIKKAMIEIYHELSIRKLRTRMLIQVHDELVFEVPVEEKSLIQDIIPKLMTRTTQLKVPLKVSTHFVKSWDKAK